MGWVGKLLLAAGAFRVTPLQGEMTLSFPGRIADRYGLTVRSLLSAVTEVAGQQDVAGALQGDSEVFLNAAARDRVAALCRVPQVGLRRALSAWTREEPLGPFETCQLRFKHWRQDGTLSRIAAAPLPATDHTWQTALAHTLARQTAATAGPKRPDPRHGRCDAVPPHRHRTRDPDHAAGAGVPYRTARPHTTAGDLGERVVPAYAETPESGRSIADRKVVSVLQGLVDVVER